MKKCTKCGEGYPVTLKYWESDGKNTLKSQCKKCRYEYKRQLRKDNPDKIRADGRRYREKHPRSTSELSRRWRIENPEKNRDSLRRSRIKHAEKYQERVRVWKINNVERSREVDRIWRSNNPEKMRISWEKRRTRKKNLPNTFTVKDWQRCLAYFNGCCAVCERPLNDLFGTHKAAMDHWIPLSSSGCPGTVPANIVPLCHGKGGCNNRKRDRDPIEWINHEFGKSKAKAIVERVEAYFKSLLL